MKQRLKVVLVLGILSILWRPTQANQTIMALPSASASEMLQLVNQFRLNNGLPPFQLNGALASAAQNQANYMAEFMVFSNHSGYGGSTPRSRAEAAGYFGSVSENIVGGTGMSARQGLIWWQNSAVHYRTLVTSRYIEAGTGFATNGNENFFVLVVGSPSNAGSAPTTPQEDSPAPLFITPIVKAEPGEDGSIVHIVQEGQALWSLSAHYEVLLSDLLLYNGLTDSSFLSPGDEIIIRLGEGQSPPPTPAPPTSVIVQEGQSLWSIAAVYNVKFADLLWFNNIDEDAVLQPGDEITIRLAEGQAPPPTPTPIMIHTVRSGQTLWDIALTYGLSLDALLSMNSISAEAILQPGDNLMIRVPPPTETPVPTATFTPQPTVVLVETAVSAHLPSAAPNALTANTPQPNISPTIAANSNALQLSETIGTGTLILVLGLVAVGGFAVYVVGRRD